MRCETEFEVNGYVAKDLNAAAEAIRNQLAAAKVVFPGLKHFVFVDLRTHQVTPITPAETEHTDA